MSENKIFSDRENRIIKFIGKKPITIAQLTDKFYGIDPPFGAQNRVAGFVRRIASKCEFYNLDWTINGKGLGRRGRRVWKDKRNRREEK